MPTIAVNLGQVESTFSDLPNGSYLGEIEKVVYHGAREAGKFPQLRVQYLVIDGDLTGRRQSQFLSLSPNAAGFLKGFFEKFGLGDAESLDVDDETDELTDPDIVGYRVIFKVGQDRKDPNRIRTELVSVEDDAAPASAPAPAPRRAVPAPVPQAAAEDDTVDADEEVEEAPARPAPAPRRPAAAPASRPTPQRRTLR